MKKNRFADSMKAKAAALYEKYRISLTKEDLRTHIQFVYVFAALAIISTVMTIMNLFTHFRVLMFQTLAFAVCNVVNVLLEQYGNDKLKKLAHVLFGFEFVALFTMFIYTGEPEGFSAIWAALLPTSGLLLFRAKWGTILSAIQFLILAFSFWTPWGQSLLPPVYTEPFKMRFPVLYIAFFVVGVFFEFIRFAAQNELEKARDHYKEMYTEEGVKASLEKERNYGIIRTLASAYASVYSVNLLTGLIEKYTLGDSSCSDLNANVDYDTAIGEYCSSKVFPEDRKLISENCTSEKLRFLLASQKSFKVEYRINDENLPKYYELRFVKVGEDLDEPDNIVIAISDIDREIREDMEKRAALEKAMKEAQVASEAKTRFLFNMSHDIRTPMNAILGYTEMAQKHVKEEEKVTDYLGKVRISGDHLLKLINDVLDMARIDNGKVEIEVADADIYECGKKLEAIVAQSAADKSLSFGIEYRNITNRYLSIDILRMNQILINIINNSVKYTPEGGKVSCLVSQNGLDAGGKVITEFRVEDNGIGMSREFVEKIFESFSRERTTTVSGIQGTGLGMTITKRLVELMNGDIRVESEAGVGTVVTVTVPFEIIDDKSAVENKVEAKEDPYCGLAGKRVLLVEDNAFNREIAQEILEDEKIVVECVNDGTEAVEILKNKGAESYDIVLMDIQMPIMDGYEATKIIRSWGGAYAKIPIIALTANAFEEDKKQALDVGMNGHIAKPIDTGCLFTLIQDL